MADDDKRADAKKNGAPKSAPEHPTPTQAENDTYQGVKKETAPRGDPPETLPPTPTQAEADEQKCKVYGTTVEKEKERRAADAKAQPKAAPEDMTPTPTQAENDAAKKAAMYEPEGSGDPQSAQAHRRQVEAGRPGGYQTRATEAAPARPE